MNSRMKLLRLFAFALVLCTYSCDKKAERPLIAGDGVGFYYFPRACTKIMTLPMALKGEISSTGGEIKHEVLVGEEGVEAKDFLYWLMTGADDLDSLKVHYPGRKGRDYVNLYRSSIYKQVAPSILPLETQLVKDYNKAASATDAQVSDRVNSGMQAKALLAWEYRVTGVKDFKIIALTPLFGLPAETSLNRFFTFYSFTPKQIISSQSKTLLWGYSDQEQVTSIDQWLSMHPMAQPAMMLRLNTMPQERPVTTRLVAILTTREGKELRDTLQVRLR